MITAPVSFYFLRHGESNVNLSGICAGSNDCTGLSTNGKSQVEALSRVMAGMKLPASFVISSPIMRTVQTAQAAARATSSPLLLDERLRERNYGTWEGRPYDAVRKQLLSGATPPEGEGTAELVARASGFFANPPVPLDNAVIVSHGGFWQTLYDMYGRGEDAPWIGYADLYAVTMTPGGITTEVLFAKADAKVTVAG